MIEIIYIVDMHGPFILKLTSIFECINENVYFKCFIFYGYILNIYISHLSSMDMKLLHKKSVNGRDVGSSTFDVVNVSISGEFSLWVWRSLQHGHTVLVYDLQFEFGFGASPARGCIGETL